MVDDIELFRCGAQIAMAIYCPDDERKGLSMMKANLMIMVACLTLLAPALPAAAKDNGRQGLGSEVDEAPGVVLVITAEDLDELIRDERLVLDRRSDTRVIVLDPGRGPIDLSRIELLLVDGSRIDAGAWLAMQEQDTTLRGPTVLAPPDRDMPWMSKEEPVPSGNTKITNTGAGIAFSPPDPSDEVDTPAACSASGGTSSGAGMATLFAPCVATFLLRRRARRRRWQTMPGA